jgi:hypothetical protein
LNMTICPQIWICPGCGSRVHLPVVSLAQTMLLTREWCDLLARCMCGCYVRGLSDTKIGLLLAAVLIAGEEGEDEGCTRASPCSTI